MPEQIKFFGAVDREKNDPNGKILSAYPAWYYEEKIDKLKDDIAILENRLANGRVPASSIEDHKKELELRKTRLKAILLSKPKVTGKEKDEVGRCFKYLRDQIINRLPSRTDVQRGTVNIRNEVMWKKKPSIDISDHLMVCESLGLSMPERKKITGHQGMLALKILAKLLGEEANIERLRRDFNNNTYKTDVSLDQLVQDGHGLKA